MNILTINCGSSSQGFKVYSTDSRGQTQVIASGKAKNVATKTQAKSVFSWAVHSDSSTVTTDIPSHARAAGLIIQLLKEKSISVDAIGHRFVHGGNVFAKTTLITPDSLIRLKQCLPFAPIHNPNSFSVIEVCLQEYPGVPQYAVFDTSFHAGMPEASREYAIPRDLVEQYGFHKYGFHGLSYQYVSARISEILRKPLPELKLILCHLGTGGSSVTAVKGGRSLDTSMGYSPTPGLVMSTRCGDLDPEIVLELVRQGRTPDEVTAILNNRSGLLGLSGYSSNLEEIITAAEQGNAACQLAYDVYAQRLNSYLGAFTWQLNGADAIVFTDDVGQKCWKLREKVCSGVENLGIVLDPLANRQAPVDQATLISGPASRTQIWVVPTDEEIMILREVLACLNS